MQRGKQDCVLVSPITLINTLLCAVALAPMRIPSWKPDIVTSFMELFDESKSTAAGGSGPGVMQPNSRIPLVPVKSLICAQTVFVEGMAEPVLKLILVYGPDPDADPETNRPVPRI